RRGQLRRPVHPPLVELRVVAQLSRDLQSRGEPVELLRRRQHVAHYLHQTLARRDIGHPLGVLVGQLEEQRVLVTEVMEDSTPRQADRLFEAAYRRSVITEFGKAATGAVKYLTAPGRQMILADLRQGCGSLRLEHVAQHVLQDAAVAVVIGFTRSVDAHYGVEFHGLPTIFGGLD